MALSQLRQRARSMTCIFAFSTRQPDVLSACVPMLKAVGPSCFRRDARRGKKLDAAAGVFVGCRRSTATDCGLRAPARTRAGHVKHLARADAACVRATPQISQELMRQKWPQSEFPALVCRYPVNVMDRTCSMYATARPGSRLHTGYDRGRPLPCSCHKRKRL